MFAVCYFQRGLVNYLHCGGDSDVVRELLTTGYATEILPYFSSTCCHSLGVHISWLYAVMIVET